MLILLLLTQTAFAVDVTCFEDLTEAFEHGESEITIDNSIQAQDNLGCPKNNASIEGLGNTIDGNNFGGVTLDSGRSMSINDVDMCNFNSVDGAVVKNTNGCTLENLSGNFYNNSVSQQGGVVANFSNITNISGYFHDNTAVINGGAIFSDQNTNIDSISGTFEKNYATEGAGGAIFNMGNIGSITADFIGNWAKDNMGGGAICNMEYIKSIEGDFTGNISDQEVFGGGGAIFNSIMIERLAGTFKDNVSKNLGGAIHNMYGKINIISDTREVEFTGNKDKTGSNAIYNEGGEINFWADNDITINDKISGASYEEQSININNENHSGNVIFNNEVSDNTVNMYAGTIKFSTNTQDDKQYFGNFTKSVDFNFYGGNVDLMTDNVQNTNLGNLTLYSDMDLKLDIDFENRISDTISADSLNAGDNHINITDFNVLTPAVEKFYSFNPASGELMNALRYTGESEMELPIYKYRVSLAGGMLNFERIDEQLNPAIFTSQVAAQLGGYLTQLNTYDAAFRNMDMYTQTERTAFLNLYAGDKYFYTKGGKLWLRPYTVFENVPLKYGPRVLNNAYGSLFGEESEPLRLRRGWSLIFSPYAGYNGSHQTFNGNGIYQNGGTLGGVVMAYKKNFYSGLTVNASANGCEADTMYGRENFSMFMTGIASKTGCNLQFKKAVVQPNLFLAYTFVKTFDYTNSAGVNITSKPLNALTISPGVKIFGTFRRDFQPYVFANMVWNVIDKANFRANEVSLPQLSVKPFILYGIGLRKLIKERFGGYIQAYVTNGGRNGVGLMFGCRWLL